MRRVWIIALAGRRMVMGQAPARVLCARCGERWDWAHECRAKQ